MEQRSIELPEQSDCIIETLLTKCMRLQPLMISLIILEMLYILHLR